MTDGLKISFSYPEWLLSNLVDIKNNQLLVITYLFLPGVEKKNDDFRRYFHRKINRWYAFTSLLLVKIRQEILSEYERQPRKYWQDDAFWFSGGKQEVAKKLPRISLPETPAQEPVTDIQTETTKRVLDQSTEQLKRLKIADLVELLNEIVGYQPDLPRQPRKPDLFSKILEVLLALQEENDKLHW